MFEGGGTYNARVNHKNEINAYSYLLEHVYT
jgi:hypothetical protein